MVASSRKRLGFKKVFTVSSSSNQSARGEGGGSSTTQANTQLIAKPAMVHFFYVLLVPKGRELCRND